MNKNNIHKIKMCINTKFNDGTIEDLYESK